MIKELKQTHFWLDEKQTELYEEFKNHDCPKKNKLGAIGGRISVTFTQTGIGAFIEVNCVCGKNQDLTNLDKL